MRAAIYARYSSENQRDASIEDQVRLCKIRIEREGWALKCTYTDRAISGASLLRPGYQKLLADIQSRRVDIVIAEALDRVSRDQEHVAAFFKQLVFAGVRFVTLAEGEISELHVGLKGTMNALFLKDLADKTRRGMLGRVEEGRSGGGLCFGYQVTKEFSARGEPVRGGRAINEAEAAVVKGIFKAYADGESPDSIAKRLNRTSVRGPNGNTWGSSTIYGNWRRGTGILNNELYVGRMIWNRLRYSKHPDTGRRISQLNPPESWVIKEVAELRIIDEALWDRVKARQKVSRAAITRKYGERTSPERVRRAAYLFSGLIKCGTCGGGCGMVNATYYACYNAREKGTCDNRLTIRRDRLEEMILEGLKARLMEPALVKEFIAEYHRELNRLSGDLDAERHRQEHDLKQVDGDIRAIIESIKAGFRTDAMRQELESLEARKRELKAALAQPSAGSVRLHPNLAEVYRRKIDELRDALNQPEARAEAVEILRELIDEIRLVSENGVLRLHLGGHLAALFALAQKENGPRLGAVSAACTGVHATMVAGARFNLYRTRKTVAK